MQLTIVQVLDRVLADHNLQVTDQADLSVIEHARHSCCVYPGCSHTRRTRGLCHGHYQVMRSRVRTGRVTELELETRGLLTPKGTGGVPARDDAKAFEAGSTVRGDA